MSQFGPHDWYYAQGDQQFGPVTLDDLKQRVAAGQMASSDLVWHEGMTQWQAISTMSGLFTPSGARLQPPLAYAAPSLSNQFLPNSARQVVYVGFWWRVLATLIDGIVTGVAGAIIGGVLGFGIGIAMGAGTQMEAVANGVGNLVGIVLGWLYSALMESSAQQATLGKMACGIIVTDTNGNRISFGRATGRHFAKFLSAIILCIGYMMAGWTERKQALHDLLASTYVIKK